jgi:hypothetical protein
MLAAQSEKAQNGQDDDDKSDDVNDAVHELSPFGLFGRVNSQSRLTFRLSKDQRKSRMMNS